MVKVVLHGNHLDMVENVLTTQEKLIVRINHLDNISRCLFEDSRSNSGLGDFAQNEAFSFFLYSSTWYCGRYL